MIEFDVKIPTEEDRDSMSDEAYEKLDLEVHEKGREFLEKVIDQEFASYKEYIMDKYGDTFGYDDFTPTKNFKTSEDCAKWQIWAYMIRGALQDIAGFGTKVIEHEFEAIYYQIAAMHLGDEGFSKRYKPLAIKLQDQKSDREWKAKMKKMGLKRS